MKTGKYSTKHKRHSQLGKAFSHPARVAILQHLLIEEECNCGQLVEILPLAQASVSQHLKALSEIEVLTSKIKGPETLYRINSDVWEEMHRLFNEMFTRYKQKKK